MVQIDVFTDRGLAGNALAVCLDGRGLSTEQMQDIARETNLSETTFILPGDAEAERSKAVRVRIFTVQEELPFAGHQRWEPLSCCGSSAAPEIRLQLNVGMVPVRFEIPQAAGGR
jgi:trans-2,3-dihydro-3-hydroxyanthranilate isomerase